MLIDENGDRNTKRNQISVLHTETELGVTILFMPVILSSKLKIRIVLKKLDP